MLTDTPPLGSTQICFWIPEKNNCKGQVLQKTAVGKVTELDVLETLGNWAQKKAEVRYLTESRG